MQPDLHFKRDGVQLVAGSGLCQHDDGVGAAASFRAPYAVAADAGHHAVVADTVEIAHGASKISLRVVDLATGDVKTLRRTFWRVTL